MTLLQLVNKVLRGLRESQASGLSTEYARLIAQLVNEAKTDIEDAGPWHALRTEVSATVASGSNSVALSGVNERSYLQSEDGGLDGGSGQPMAFISEPDFENRLRLITMDKIRSLRATNPDADPGIPYAVALERTAGGLTAHVYPDTDRDYDLALHFVIPQDDLEDPADELSIPGEPVWREALVRAMEERGEEFAGPLDKARDRAGTALAKAIMRDFGSEPVTFEAM